MLVSKTKQKLRDGKPVFGVVIGINDPFIAQIIGKAGFDYILIDGQHGPVEPSMLYQMVSSMGQTESDVVVRVTSNEPWMIGQALDMGADGVIVPLVDSAADARKAVDAAKYPPMGHRSNGARKTWRYDNYQVSANEETIVWPQIETSGAIDDIDGFLKVDGLDGIMIGPSDLGYALGVQPPDDQIQHPKTQETIQFILDKCKEHGVPWGMFSGLEEGEKWIRRGGQIVTIGGDLGFITEGAAQTLAECKRIEASL